MARKNYIFTNKKHSKKAIMSTVLGTISLISLNIVIYLSYLSGGVAQSGYGVTGFLATVFSITGLGLGIAAVRNKDYYRVFPWVGTVLNLITLGCISFLLYFGSRI